MQRRLAGSEHRRARRKRKQKQDDAPVDLELDRAATRRHSPFAIRHSPGPAAMGTADDRERAGASARDGLTARVKTSIGARGEESTPQSATVFSLDRCWELGMVPNPDSTIKNKNKRQLRWGWPLPRPGKRPVTALQVGSLCLPNSDSPMPGIACRFPCFSVDQPLARNRAPFPSLHWHSAAHLEPNRPLSSSSSVSSHLLHTMNPLDSRSRAPQPSPGTRAQQTRH